MSKKWAGIEARLRPSRRRRGGLRPRRIRGRGGGCSGGRGGWLGRGGGGGRRGGGRGGESVRGGLVRVRKGGKGGGEEGGGGGRYVYVEVPVEAVVEI